MTVTMLPALTVAGLDVVTPATSSLYAVDRSRIQWGRGSVLEQPTPSTLDVTVRDRSLRGSGFARRTDLIGQPVVAGYHAAGQPTAENFRGRITDIDVDPLTESAGGGFRVQLAASSAEVDLANIVIAEGTVWPAETFAARRTRLAALLPGGSSGPFFGGIEVPRKADLGLTVALTPAAELDTLTAAQQDVGGKSLLELLRQLFASMAPLPMVYDPIAGRLRTSTRRRYTYNATRGMTPSARLVTSAEHGGRYVAATLDGIGHLDGRQLAYGKVLSQPIDARITRVEVTYLDGTVAYDSRVASADTADTAAEPTIGRRVLTVDTIHADALAAARLAGFYADVVNREARTPRLSTVGYSTARQGFSSAFLASGLISCAEIAGTFFLQSTWLPWVGQNPQVGNLGGTVSYTGGDDPRWDVDFVPAPVVVDPAPYAWAPITVAAAALDSTIRLRDIDPSVTFGDLGFIDVGAGRTSSTAVTYKGNPS